MTDHPKYKFIEAMPNPKSFLQNLAIVSGESMLVWLGKLQGQIDHRLQSFFNSSIPSPFPRLVRFYHEKSEPVSHTNPAKEPMDYLVFPFTVVEGQEGLYILNLNMIVGSSSSSCDLSFPVLLNGSAVFSTIVQTRVSNVEQRVPLHLTKRLSLVPGDHVLKVQMNKSGTFFGNSDVTVYHASVDMLRSA